MSESFVSVYDRERYREHRLSPDLEDVLAPGEEWAKYLGVVLYDYLDGNDDPHTDAGKKFDDYLKWMLLTHQHTVKQVQSGPWQLDEKLEAYSRLNFHSMNLAMISMWQLEGERRQKRAREIWRNAALACQDQLSLLAIRQYVSKEINAGEKYRYSYFDKKNEAERGQLEGALTEIDAAIVLLEVSKREARNGQKLTIVPGPPQFEHGLNPAVNADFVVIGEDRKAIGIQVKSHLTQEELARYDASRLVFIDGKLDLGNQLARRTAPEDSQIRAVGWAGLIAAQRMIEVSPSRSYNSTLLGKQATRMIVGLKMRARPMVKDIAPALPKAAEIIGARLMEKLSAAPEAETGKDEPVGRQS